MTFESLSQNFLPKWIANSEFSKHELFATRDSLKQELSRSRNIIRRKLTCLSRCKTQYNKQPLISSGGNVPGAQHPTSHYTATIRAVTFLTSQIHARAKAIGFSKRVLCTSNNCLLHFTLIRTKARFFPNGYRNYFIESARANDFHSRVITKYRKTNESVYWRRFKEWINIVQSTFNVDVCFTHYNIRSKQKQFCTHSSPFFQLFTQYFSEKSSTNKRNSYSIPCAVCRAMSSNCRTSNLLSMTWRCRYKLDPSHHWVTIASWGLAIQPINSRMLTCRVFLQYKKKPRFYPGSESQIAIEALKRMRQAPHLPPPLH